MALSMIDCFAGAGGMSLGLRRAGFEPLFAFDWSAAAVSTYRANIDPSAEILDVRKVDGRTLTQLANLPPHQRLDLLTGGPPCQGFSRQRRGADVDPRNDLVFEFERLVREVQPRSFLMENVAAILAPRGAAIFSELVTRFQRLGYRVHYAVLDAADYGVPQHRKRMFMVGFHPSVTQAFEFPAAEMPMRTVRQAFAGLGPPAAQGAIPNHDPDNISDLNRLRISHVPEGGGRDDIPTSLRLACHAVSTAKAGHRGVYGRLWWDRPAGTITTKCNSFTRGRFAHPTENRNITMREAARLQSFPDDFSFLGGKVDVAHQIGNAVPPLLAYKLGAAIARSLASSGESFQKSQELNLAV